jgi:hypothetical protein
MGLAGQGGTPRTTPKRNAPTFEGVQTNPKETDKSYVRKAPTRKPTTLYLDPDVFNEFSKVNSYKGEKSDLINYLLAKHFGLIEEDQQDGQGV